MLKNLLAGLLGLVFALGCAEILIRLCLSQEQLWLLDDYVYRAVEGELKYTLKPSIRGFANNQPLVTNSAGFRGPQWPQQRTANSCNIAFLGDSHTFGFGVAYQQGFPQRVGQLLQARYPRHQVHTLNFGVNGYNARQLLAVGSELLPRYPVDGVVITVSSNDHEAPLWVSASGALHWRQPTSDAERRDLNKPPSWWLQHSNLLGWSYIVYRRWQGLDTVLEHSAEAVTNSDQALWPRDFPAATPSARLQHTVYAPLTQLIRQLRRQGIPVVLASVNGFMDYNQMLNLLAQEWQLPHVSLLAQLPDMHSWEEVLAHYGLGWDSHLNGQAHAIWAKALAPLISCPS